MVASHPPDSAALLARARALAEARDWSGLAASADDLSAETIERLPELGYLCADALQRTGRTAPARDLVERIAPVIRRGGGRRLILRLLNLQGVIAFEGGEVAEAEGYFASLLDQATGWGDDEFTARASNNLGVLANVRGQRELALTCYQRALAAYQRLGHLRGLAQTHYNLGISHRDLGRDDDADRHYRRAVHFAGRSGSEDVIALAETERAAVRIREGDASLADRLLSNAQRRFQALGDPVRSAEVLRVRASAAVTRGLLEDARGHLEEAYAVARTHSNLLLRAEVQRDRGAVLRSAGDEAAAREAFLDAAEAFSLLGAVEEAAAARTAASTP